MNRTILTVAWLALAALPAATALATQPDPPMSTWDERVGRSPKNLEVGDPTFQYVFRGTLRNQNGEPVVGYPASGVKLVINPPCQNPVELRPDGPSDGNGGLVWGAAKLDQGGGSCAGNGVVYIVVDAVGIMASRPMVASPDEGGDGIIALDDLVTFQQAFVGQSNPHQGDLDLDGAIALSDLVFFQHHFTAP